MRTLRTGELPLSTLYNIWPIQASSLEPRRYRIWKKHNKALLLGMPLWNADELFEGYVLSFPALIMPHSAEVRS